MHNPATHALKIHSILWICTLSFLSGCIDTSSPHPRASLTAGKDIYKLCYRFAEDNQGRFPDSLKSKDFIKQLDSNQRELVRSPIAGVGFFYISGYRIGDAGLKILFYSTPVGDSEGRNVIYLDGEGKFVTKEDFQTELAEQKKQVGNRFKIHRNFSN